MPTHTRHPYPTQRGPRRTDWALLAFILCAYAWVMHADHQAELREHIAEVKAQQKAQKQQHPRPATQPPAVEVASK